MRPTDGSRYYRIDDDWTTKRQATLNMEWTGSTNFEENNTYEDEFILDDPEEAQEAKRATGIPAPQQPTEQERLEHELTHLPTIQKLVSSMRPKQGTTEQSSKADNKTASNPS